MSPGTYEIPKDVQADMRDMAEMITNRANRPHAPLSASEKMAMLAIAEKIATLGSYDFTSGNEMVLMKPDFTFGYVRMGCALLMNPSLPTAEPVWSCAQRVGDWLDEIGHRFPNR